MNKNNNFNKVFQYLSLVSMIFNILNPLFVGGLYVYAEENASQEEVIVDDSNSTVDEEKSTSEDTPQVLDEQNDSDINDESISEDTTIEETEEISEPQEVVEPTQPEDLSNNETSTDTNANANVENEDTTVETEGDILDEAASDVRETTESEDTIIEETEEVIETPVTEVEEVITPDTICLSFDSEINVSSEDIWNIDTDNNIATTKENVQIGVKYEFPLNKDVSVMFSCLPTDVSKLSTLKIQQVKVSDLTLPEGVYPADEYAYDITTDMENGTFEYDLTLPSTEEDEKNNVAVTYIEKDIEEIKDSVTKEDLKEVRQDSIEYSNKGLEVSDLNHFTLFIKTYTDLLFTVEGTSFTRGATVNIKADDLLSNKYYRLSIKPFSGSRTYITTCTTGVTSLSNAYVLASNAALGNWEAGVHQFDTSGSCNSASVSTPTAISTFAVTLFPTISWPTSWTTPGTCLVDPKDDESPSSTDLYGTLGSSAVGFKTDSSYYYFREKVDGDPYSSRHGWSQYAWVVLFQFTSGPYNYLASLNGKDDVVQLWKNTTPAGTVDFDPLLNDPAETLLWSGPASTYARETSAGGNDYYVDWALPKSLLEGLGITVDTTKFFATSANANNYNKDHLKCYEILADLSIVKTDSADPVYTNGSLGYTLTVTNNGPDTAKSVVVTDTLPSGYSVISVTPSQGSCSDVTAPSIKCELGDMINGSSATVTITGTAPSTSQTITNTTSVSCDTTLCTDRDQTNNTDTEDTTILASNGTLIVNKTLINDNGGTKGYTDFSFKVNNGSNIVFENDGSNQITVPAGNYTIVENASVGYATSYNNCSNVVITSGGTATCTITNNDIAPKLTVTKVVTNDNGGTKVVSDFNLYVGNTAVVSGVQNTFDAGSYTISEDAVSGYTGTISGDCSENGSITLEIGDVKSCTITNDDQAGTLIVKKVLPNDNGSVLGADYFSFNINDGKDISFESDGQNDITVDSGYYTVVETNPITGDAVTYDNCSEVFVPNGGSATCTITNDDQNGTVSGYKWEDLNENAEWDEGESSLPNWTIYIDANDNNELDEGEESTTTDENGNYIFSLNIGEYKVCEVQQDDWVQTYPINTRLESYCHYVEVTSGSTIEDKNFGNFNKLPVLGISKSNNRGGDQLKEGDEVVYTITVTADEEGGSAKSVKTVDLLPKGIKYKSSSWTADSSVRGDISALGEPTYNSPGTWTLGDMLPGEVVTLTYVGFIQTGTDEGIYKDLAWAKDTEQNILASAQPEGYVSDSFVGTEVEVIKDIAPVEDEVEVNVEEKEVEVLGASSVRLPATGSTTTLLFSILLVLLLGVFMVTYSTIKDKTKKVFEKTLMSSLFFLGFSYMFLGSLLSNNVYAEEVTSDLMVRLEEPKSSFNTAFDLTFVALDLNNNTIEVECYKKGPSDGSFSKFGSSINLNAGGDTSTCTISDSVLLDEGTYEFKVKAMSESGEVYSDVVTTTYDGTGPSRPKYIEVDRKSSCKYEIEFKTADDGQTTYVEVYRDDDKDIEINDGSKIATINVGPNTEHTFDYDAGGDNCSRYYFAVRAFDASNNPSKPRSESIEETKEVTVEGETEETVEQDAIEVTGGSILGTLNNNDENGEEKEEILGELSNLGDTASANTESKELSFFDKLLQNKLFWIFLILLGAKLLSDVIKKSKQNKK